MFYSVYLRSLLGCNGSQSSLSFMASATLLRDCDKTIRMSLAGVFCVYEHGGEGRGEERKHLIVKNFHEQKPHPLAVAQRYQWMYSVFLDGYIRTGAPYHCSHTQTTPNIKPSRSHNTLSMPRVSEYTHVIRYYYYYDHYGWFCFTSHYILYISSAAS